MGLGSKGICVTRGKLLDNRFTELDISIPLYTVEILEIRNAIWLGNWLRWALTTCKCGYVYSYR
jgi:hypothetical protein